MANCAAMAIGSCRIQGVLVRARDEFGVTIDATSQYAFIYNTKEIIQQIRHLRGEFTISARMRAFLNHARVNWIERGVGIAQAAVYFVEISNAKFIEWDGFFPQQTAVNKQLLAAGAPVMWDILWNGDWRDHDAVRRRIRARPEFDGLSCAMQDFLMSVTISIQEPHDLREDMALILVLLGRERVIFLSKPTATASDGALPPSRQKFVDEIKDAAADLGVRFFDPTPMLHSFGQQRGLIDGGRILHYTPEFEATMTRHVVAQFLQSA